VSILPQRAHYLGTVEASDERTAEATAAVQFGLDEEQRKQLVTAFPPASPTPAIANCALASSSVGAWPFVCTLDGLPTTPYSDQNQRMWSGPPRCS
jgi:NaMN:DMB phosphoribosyltransferase